MLPQLYVLLVIYFGGQKRFICYRMLAFILLFYYMHYRLTYILTCSVYDQLSRYRNIGLASLRFNPHFRKPSHNLLEMYLLYAITFFLRK